MENKRKIKVMEFISSMHHGGAETLVKDYACILNKDQFDVVVVTTAGRSNSFNEKILDEHHIKTYYVGNKFSGKNIVLKAIGKYARYFSLYDVINKEKPDIIHCHLGAINFIAKIMKYKKINCKLIFTVHCDLERQLNMKGIRKSVEFLMKNCDLKIIALHQAMRLELIEKYGDRHYLVLNNGTDLGKYNLPESTRAEIRQAEGIPVDAFVLGHIGRFIDAKNHVFLLKIFCEILKKNQNSRLLLVGDGELKSDIHVLARKYGIAEKVIFTGLRGDIPELLKAMDVFCLPSKTEGVPVTVVEAQAAGVKCVISDVVVDDVMLTNRIFKMSLEESESMWADKILYGKEHSNEKNMLINFDIHHVITQLSKYYEEILDGKI